MPSISQVNASDRCTVSTVATANNISHAVPPLRGPTAKWCTIIGWMKALHYEHAPVNAATHALLHPSAPVRLQKGARQVHASCARVARYFSTGSASTANFPLDGSARRLDGGGGRDVPRF